jgi:hypothetical protein
VRSAASVDINLQRRIFLNQRTGGTGVIQVNMREQNRIQVRDAKAVNFKLFAQGGQCRARAGVDHSGKVIGAEQRGGDAPCLSGPVQVKQGGNNHKE